MNNKGQTLVLFVLILPIFFLIIYFLIDRVYLYQEKNNIDNILDTLCDYSKKTDSNDKIIELGLKNDKDLDIGIKRKNDKLEITITKRTKLFDKKIVSSTVCE